MTVDPLGGRIPSASAQPPYSNALSVTPTEGDDLPVIPLAIYIPHVQIDTLSPDGDFQIISIIQDTTKVQSLAVEMQNGAQITLHAAGLSKDGWTIILPMRIRKILWDQSSATAVTLLW